MLKSDLIGSSASKSRGAKALSDDSQANFGRSHELAGLQRSGQFAGSEVAKLSLQTFQLPNRFVDAAGRNPIWRI